MKCIFNMKGIIFAGCSFTWGHGLWYYSELDNLPKSDKDIDFSNLKSSYLDFISIKRFSRIVANYFNTYDVVKSLTAGSDQMSLTFLNTCFSKRNQNTKYNYLVDKRYEYSDIDYIIFQTTYPDRNEINMDKNDLDLYMEKSAETWYKIIKKKFEFYESKGIKCRILSITNHYVKHILNDEWMKKKFIPMIYKNKKYHTILDLYEQNPNMSIGYDDYFKGNFPDDFHPSILCHKTIAQSIIEFIDNDITDKKTII